MIPGILLDPAVFWLLDGHERSESEMEDALVRATHWLKPVPIRGVPIFFSNIALEKLGSAGYFPAEPHLKQVLERANLTHVITPRQLAANIARFLSNATAIEDRGPIKYGIFENVKPDPDIFSEIGEAELRELSHVTASLMAAHCELNSGDQDNLVYAYNRTNQDSQRVTLRTDVLGLEPPQLEVQIGEHLERDISVLSVPSAYSCCLDALAVWRKAETTTALRWAIQSEAERMVRVSGRTSVRKFLIGTEFLRLLQVHQCLGEGRYSALVLAKCSQLVADSENVEVHDFRESEAPTSPARRRAADGAVGKRVHITESHEALHLMFWARVRGVIEFAAVRGKFELVIDEGDPDLAA